MKKIVIGIAQIQSHPALSISYVDCLSEPFFTSVPQESLSFLNMKGIGLEESSLQIRQEYLEHQIKKISAIQAFYQNHFPELDLLLFPEGSVPPHALPILADYSRRLNLTIIAGSHSFFETKEYDSIYRSLGSSCKTVKAILSKGCNNLLTLIKNGKVKFITKKYPSLFEKSDIPLPSDKEHIIGIEKCSATSGQYSILPLNCSEAVADPPKTRDFDLASIISFNEKKDSFSPFIDVMVKTKHHVVYCNDAKYGNSHIHLSWNRHMSSILFDFFPEGLPACEANLVAELNLDVKAVDSGVTTPDAPFKLLNISPILYESDENTTTMKNLHEIQELTTSSGRANSLRTYLKEFDHSPISKILLSHLAEEEHKGVNCDQIWAIISKYCLVPSCPLESLENRFGTQLSINVTPPENFDERFASQYFQFLKRCRLISKSKPSKSVSFDSPINMQDIIDRDYELTQLNTFLKSPDKHLLQINGLEQIGKSYTVEKASSLIPKKFWCIIHLLESSSVDYILASIASKSGFAIPIEQEPNEVLTSPAFKASLSSYKIIFFSKCHNLFDRAGWKEPIFNSVFDTLLSYSQELGFKVICESRWSLPIESSHHELIKRFQIKGFSRGLEVHGKVLLDQAFYKIESDPNIVSDQEKSEIIKKVGGHPKALALCAIEIKNMGKQEFFKKLRKSTLLVLPMIRAMVRRLMLTEVEKEILSLLSIPQIPIPLEIISRTLDKPIEREIGDLVSMSAIEPSAANYITCSDVIKSSLVDHELPDEKVKLFNLLCYRKFRETYESNPNRLEYLQESIYHGTLAGEQVVLEANAVDGFVSAAVELSKKKKYDQAISVLESIKSHSKSIEISKCLAISYANIGDNKRTLENAKSAFLKNPRNSFLLNDILNIALKTRNKSLSIEIIKLAKAARIEEVGILMAEGRMALRENKYDECEAIFKKAIQKDSRNAWPFFWLGVLYQKTNEIDLAIDILERGVSFLEDLPYSRDNIHDAIFAQLAFVYAQAGNAEVAESYFSAIRNTDDLRGSTLKATFSVILLTQGIDKAKEFLDKNKSKIFSKDLNVLYGLYYLELGDYSNAYSKLRSAHTYDPYDVFIMVKFADACLHLALEQHSSGFGSHITYAKECVRILSIIHTYNSENEDYIRLSLLMKDQYPELILE